MSLKKVNQHSGFLPATLPEFWIAVDLTTEAPGILATATQNPELRENAALQYWQAYSVSPDVRVKAIWNASSDDREFGFSVPVSEKQAAYVRDGCEGWKQ